MREAWMVVAVAIAACGGPARRSVLAPGVAMIDRLATQPCRAMREVGDPPVLILGGTRDEQVSYGGMITLESGDGVLLSGIGDRAEISWWSDGACRWRAELPRGAGGAHATGDTIWLRMSTSETDAHERWGEIDADGRISRTASAGPNVRAVVAQDDGRVLFLIGTLGDHRWWDLDTLEPVRTLPLDVTAWDLAVAQRGAPPAVLATTTSQATDDRFDPRVLLGDGRVVPIGKGPADRGAIRALPGGGWLAAYSARDGQAHRVTAVELDAGGRVVATAQSGDLGNHLIASIDEDGIAIVAQDSEHRWQRQRLRVDLDAGTLERTDDERGARWTVGLLQETTSTVEEHAISLESWHVPETIGRCGSQPGYQAVAQALYILPPAR